MRAAIAILATALLVACDGPRENAGERADAASGAVNSEDTLRSGPQEALGEAQDQAAEAEREAAEARAEALEAQADEVRRRADEQADQLEQQAETTRQD